MRAEHMIAEHMTSHSTSQSTKVWQSWLGSHTFCCDGRSLARLKPGRDERAEAHVAEVAEPAVGRAKGRPRSARRVGDGLTDPAPTDPELEPLVCGGDLSV